MPKQCSHSSCSYAVFGGGYCKNHQYLRKDKKQSPRKRTKIKPQSDKQKERLEKYYPLRKEYLSLNPVCEFEGCKSPATEIHHKKSRVGDNLYKHFMAICRTHHRFIEENSDLAKKLGYSLNRL